MQKAEPIVTAIKVAWEPEIHHPWALYCTVAGKVQPWVRRFTDPTRAVAFVEQYPRAILSGSIRQLRQRASD